MNGVPIEESLNYLDKDEGSLNERHARGPGGNVLRYDEPWDRAVNRSPGPEQKDESADRVTERLGASDLREETVDLPEPLRADLRFPQDGRETVKFFVDLSFGQPVPLDVPAHGVPP